jgi:PD-(D/E)XK nuclease superfamily
MGAHSGLPIRSVMGSLKRFTRSPRLTRCAGGGLGVVQQGGVVVFYDDVLVGEYTADRLVEDQVIVELKGVAALERRACPAMPQ